MIPVVCFLQLETKIYIFAHQLNTVISLSSYAYSEAIKEAKMDT